VTVLYKYGASLSAGTITLTSGDHVWDDTLYSSELSPSHVIGTLVLAVVMAWAPERALVAVVEDLEGLEADWEGEGALE
jgi:hypothetical protein